MIQNYLKIALRNLLRNKVYSFINIGGLSVGLAAGVMLFMWVQDELSFDNFHLNPQNIYRVSTQIKMNGKEESWGTTPAPIAYFGLKEVPEIDKACRISEGNQYLYQYKDKKILQGKVAFVEDSFFNMFNFPLLKGNAKKPFRTPFSMVLSKSVAKKYFQDEDPIGKIIKVDNQYDCEVSGVIDDMPSNSSLRYEVLVSFEVAKKQFGGNGAWKTVDEDWGNYNYTTFFKLKNATSAQNVAKKITKIHQTNQKNEFTATMNYLLQSIGTIHLYKADGSEDGVTIVKIMGLIGIIILLIACINYVNLATARATKRAKEVSVRKIIGANKSQIFGQFMSESVIIFTVSLLFALGLITLLVPFYNDVTGKTLVFSLFNPQMLSILGVTILVTTLLAGVYPAVLLSSFKPLEMMKGTTNASGGKNATFRKGLVVMQFLFSIILIISTLIIGNQMDYIRKKNLGYDKDNILTFGMRDIYQHYDAVKNELLKNTGVKAITSAGGDVLNNYSSTGDADWDGKAPNRTFIINQLSVDNDFLKVMNIPLIAGTDFTRTPADSVNYIFNETAIAQMGIQNPIGKRFKFHEKNGRILGVVKDFHFKNMHSKIEPMIMFYSPWRWKMYVRTTPDKAQDVIASVEKVWKQYNPLYPFEYSFMEDDFNRMYRTDQIIGKLFNFFALIAILVSCLGLFGLITYTAQTKVKEIGIRKVLGASVINILTMLSKDFVQLVLVATVIAFPIAWFSMNKLLENYAYRVAITWQVFALAGVLALLVTLLTVSYQAIRAALANPVKSLRTE